MGPQTESHNVELLCGGLPWHVGWVLTPLSYVSRMNLATDGRNLCYHGDTEGTKFAFTWKWVSCVRGCSEGEFAWH